MKEIRADGGTAEAVTLDLADSASIRAVVDQVEQLHATYRCSRAWPPSQPQYAGVPPPCDAPHLTPHADPPRITGQSLGRRGGPDRSLERRSSAW